MWFGNTMFLFFEKNNEEISTLILQNFVLSETLENFKELFRKKQRWILCEKDISSISSFYMRAWLTRLYTERLERKNQRDSCFCCPQQKNDWEAVLFVLLAKKFWHSIEWWCFFEHGSVL